MNSVSHTLLFRAFLSLIFTLCLIGKVEATHQDTITLSQLEVSAGQNKILDNPARLITVIDRIEIEKSAATGIDDLLRYVSGIDIRSRGGNGVQADISIRGSTFDQVLILLNGINITDPQTGHHNLNIPVDISTIDRIEIVQGSAARLLGIYAFAGAINIITNEYKHNSVQSKTEAGSFAQFNQSITGNYIGSKFKVRSSLAYNRSDGHLENTDFNTKNGYTHVGFGTDQSGFYQVQLGYNEKAFGANSFYSLAYPNQFEATRTIFVSAMHTKSFQKLRYNGQLYIRRHQDRFELFRSMKGTENFPWYTGHNYHLTDVHGLKLSFSMPSLIGQTMLAADLRKEHIYSNVLGESSTKLTPVPFEQDVFFDKETGRLLGTIIVDHAYQHNYWHFSGGVAITGNRQFGLLPTGGIDVTYQIHKNSRIYLAANSAIRLPTFTDLFYQSATQISNPNLLPEKSKTLESGFKVDENRLQLSGNIYYRRGTNIIDWIKHPSAEKWESQNITAVNAIGTDLSAVYDIDKKWLHTVRLSYFFLSLDKEAGDYDSKYALDYLKHKWIATFSHLLPCNIKAQWNSGYFIRSGTYTNLFSGKLENYNPYLLLDLKLVRESKNFDIFATGSNLFNRKFEDFGGIIQPGFSVRAGIKLKISSDKKQ